MLGGVTTYGDVLSFFILIHQFVFFFQAEDGIRDDLVTGVQTCALPILDWAQSDKSRWFLRASTDSYLTRNAMVQQAALPSTGATSHNNYFNLVVGQQYAFNPYWFGSFVLNASGLHLTSARNSNLGYALDFPVTSTRSTISGLDTFCDNHFINPITAFPLLTNQ